MVHIPALLQFPFGHASLSKNWWQPKYQKCINKYLACWCARGRRINNSKQNLFHILFGSVKGQTRNNNIKPFLALYTHTHMLCVCFSSKYLHCNRVAYKFSVKSLFDTNQAFDFSCKSNNSVERENSNGMHTYVSENMFRGNFFLCQV